MFDFGNNLVVDGTSRLSGEVRVDTGIVPDTDEGAYLGTTAKPWLLTLVKLKLQMVKVANDNTIKTASGNLILDSNGGLVDINDNLNVSGNLDVAGDLDIMEF